MPEVEPEPEISSHSTDIVCGVKRVIQTIQRFLVFIRPNRSGAGAGAKKLFFKPELEPEMEPEN